MGIWQRIESIVNMHEYFLKAICLVLLCAAFTYSLCETWWWIDDKDPMMLWRYVMIRLQAINLCFTAEIVGLLLMDWFTPNDWLKEAFESENRALIVCANIIAIAWILVSA